MIVPKLKINKMKQHLDKYAIVVKSKIKNSQYLYHANKEHPSYKARFRTGKNPLIIITHSNARELYEYALNELHLDSGSFAICDIISDKKPIPVDPYGQHREIEIPVLQ
jgi:hypothetical protein